MRAELLWTFLSAVHVLIAAMNVYVGLRNKRQADKNRQTAKAAAALIEELRRVTRGVAAVQPWQVKVHCSKGERILRAGMQWHDGMSGSTWEVVEPEGGRIYSPSGFGGTPTFWCKPVGEPPEAAKVWLQGARADGCVSFCGDSIAAGLVSPHGVGEVPRG